MMSSDASAETTLPHGVYSDTPQREVSRLCAQCAALVFQHGAESALVEQIATRLGRALGMDHVDIVITAGGIALTTRIGAHCVTTVRRNVERGINMRVVTDVQNIVIRAEREGLNAPRVQTLVDGVRPRVYPGPLLVLMVGLSCGCFARLAGADWAGMGIASLAGALAMAVRLFITRRHFNALLAFCLGAFAATSAAGLLCAKGFTGTPQTALASSVLLFVPGFPLINAVSDIFKGYSNTFMSRWTQATLLTIATCIGIFLALEIWGVKGWL